MLQVRRVVTSMAITLLLAFTLRAGEMGTTVQPPPIDPQSSPVISATDTSEEVSTEEVMTIEGLNLLVELLALL